MKSRGMAKLWWWSPKEGGTEYTEEENARRRAAFCLDYGTLELAGFSRLNLPSDWTEAKLMRDWGFD